MIRQDKVQGISCTGANLEEGLFLLCGQQEYVSLPNYRDFSAKDDAVLRKKNLNRVTDVAIPDKVANRVLDAVMPLWEEADATGRRQVPARVSVPGRHCGLARLKSTTRAIRTTAG